MEMVITITSISSTATSVVNPDTYKESRKGYGTFTRSMSGKPMEIVRGKRVESITLSYSAMSMEEYEMLKYVWDNSLYFKLQSYVPKVDFNACFIPIDGFNLSPGIADKYEGSVNIVVS
jgi:hypothetical protein